MVICYTSFSNLLNCAFLVSFIRLLGIREEFSGFQNLWMDSYAMISFEIFIYYIKIQRVSSFYWGSLRGRYFLFNGIEALPLIISGDTTSLPTLYIRTLYTTIFSHATVNHLARVHYSWKPICLKPWKKDGRKDYLLHEILCFISWESLTP